MNIGLSLLGEALKREDPEWDNKRKLSEETVGMIKEFLDRYGYRADARSLTEPRWAEDPSKVISIVRAMARGPQISLRGHSRPKVPLALATVATLARVYLELREELRDVLDRLLWAQRQILQNMDCLLGLGGAIYNLSLQEILSLRSANAPEAQRVPTPSHMKGWRMCRFPTRYFVDGNAVEAHMEKPTWEGVPTSGGRIKGKTRVVSSIQDALRAKSNEILIATSMGPTWTSVLPLVSGVILAEGSMLDHFSIVAREYGVPCIVGAGHGVLRLPDGTVVEVDGSEGKIWILDLPP
jgi:pyruvate,water dikinase